MPRESRIVFLVQLPPPVHGVTVMNQLVVSSETIRSGYKCRVLPIRVSGSNTEIGTLSLLKIFRTIALAFRLMHVLLTFRPAVVYFTFSPVGLNVFRDCLLLLLIRVSGAKAILHLHGANIEKGIHERPFITGLFRASLKGAYIISLSRALAVDVRRVYRGRPFVIPNTIEYDPAELDLDRKSHHGTRILFLSNLRQEKGIFTFLDALSELLKRGCRFDAHVVGQPYRLTVEQVRAEVERRGLSGRVNVVGPRFDREKYREFSETDILVFPSRNEAFPLVLIEAAAWGIPVVSSAVGAIRDIVRDGVNGFVIDGDDYKAYADKIQLLLNDARLRDEMGTRSRKIFDENYTPEVFEKNLRRVFESVLAAGH